MSTPYHVTCPQCGSPNVACDASARWSFERQDWVLSDTHDDRMCDDCGYESHSFDGTDEASLTPEQRAAIADGADYAVTREAWSDAA